MSVNKTNHAIHHWIVIYPVDNVIHPLNNPGQYFKTSKFSMTFNLLDLSWENRKQKYGPNHVSDRQLVWGNGLSWWLTTVISPVQTTKAWRGASLHWDVPGCFAVPTWLAQCSGTQSFHGDCRHGWSWNCTDLDRQSQGKKSLLRFQYKEKGVTEILIRP